MALTIGDTAPDFTAQTTAGDISFHDWIGDGWAVLFSHPRAFTPVCTTELGYMASIQEDFEKLGTKIIAISTDPVEASARWTDDIQQNSGAAVNYPIIADTDHAVAKAYSMLPPDVDGDPTERTPAQNATLRNVFVIGPDKKIKLVMIYPMTTGRNFDEILRVIQSLQLTAEQQLTTPAQWQPGEDVILAGSVSEEQANERYPDGWETPLPYMRVVPAP
jgi:alkyl hydroperoxide reductase subunit AhpC